MGIRRVCVVRRGFGRLIETIRRNRRKMKDSGLSQFFRQDDVSPRKAKAAHEFTL